MKIILCFMCVLVLVISSAIPFISTKPPPPKERNYLVTYQLRTAAATTVACQIFHAPAFTLTMANQLVEALRQGDTNATVVLINVIKLEE